MPGALNLIKLSVGTESVADLAEWQARRCAERKAAGRDPRPRHVTRMWPRRAGELLDGGSIYWVIKGAVLVRQRLVAFDEAIGEDGIRRCAIVYTPELIRVEARPRGPFQGWRYLKGTEAPVDLGPWRGGDGDLPPDLETRLVQIGLMAGRAHG